jgi:multidrug efflux pump subunit AcrB
VRELDRLFGVVRIEAPIMGAIVRPEHADLPGMRRVLAEMRQLTVGVPGPEAVFITQSPLFRSSSGFFGGTNVDINVKGADLETVRETAQRLEGALRGLEGVNFVFSSFELIDRERAAALGLSVTQLGEIVETLNPGLAAGGFRSERGLRPRHSGGRNRRWAQPSG